MASAVAVLGIVALAGYVLLKKKRNENDTGVDVYNSDASLTSTPITEDQSTWPGSDKIWEICAAIAVAEGYDQGAGTVPFDLNNPGDISDYAGTYGSQKHSGSNVTTFPTAEIGWQKLYEKISNMVTGKSKMYSGKTWTQVAQIWAGDWENWLNNVTEYLGVEKYSLPSDYVRMGGAGGSY